MPFCEEHKALDSKIDHVVEVVNRLDHGINGVDGSIRLVKRVESMETVIHKNKVLWSNLRGVGSSTAIIIRTLAVAILMALGGYLWHIIWGGLGV